MRTQLIEISIIYKTIEFTDQGNNLAKSFPSLYIFPRNVVSTEKRMEEGRRRFISSHVKFNKRPRTGFSGLPSIILP